MRQFGARTPLESPRLTGNSAVLMPIAPVRKAQRKCIVLWFVSSSLGKKWEQSVPIHSAELRRVTEGGWETVLIDMGWRKYGGCLLCWGKKIQWFCLFIPSGFTFYFQLRCIKCLEIIHTRFLFLSFPFYFCGWWTGDLFRTLGLKKYWENGSRNYPLWIFSVFFFLLFFFYLCSTPSVQSLFLSSVGRD